MIISGRVALRLNYYSEQSQDAVLGQEKDTGIT
jgi:hypothetical protein